MTAALEIWHRRPSRVQALELSAPADLHCAEVWLRAHHAEVTRLHPALLAADALRFRQWPSRLWLTVTLGQRLTRDVRTGRFEVHLEGEFLAVHRRAGGLGELEALIDRTTDEGESA